ncbi:sugar phosphate isomerase/epimerase family protein [Puniceicoccus vermicola]|uniref:Sugar phosphate isomerase/epimerase n=1 Tax=Puniceicoccus vermicola TaxID=388746 RepID=A0A7X1AV72_9BACT|nr:sugar phosphate isomerase/epimerase [Puniceicoccus vermicola]MBC2600324.1 sugar phosphate isomerase/epimerase [Puniceicoccus vermicola]
MKLEQVAAITYTIRDHCQTESDFRKSMFKLAEIGYRAVQISTRPPIEEMKPSAILEACKDAGLTICATHEPSKTIVENPEASVEVLQRLNCKYTAFPHPGDIDLTNLAEIENLAKKLDHAGSVFRKAGQILTYHNHAIELIHLQDKTVLEHIYEKTDPANLMAELDTYWIHAAGCCMLDWSQKLKGRLPLLHLKDIGVLQKNQIGMMEIGAGNLDFKAIIAAAETAGCEWFIVEQDHCPGDPFDSLRKSFDYIRSELVTR